MTAKIQSCLFASRAMSEGHMPVGNIVEEVDFALIEQQSSSNGVHRSIAPTLVEEAAVTI